MLLLNEFEHHRGSHVSDFVKEDLAKNSYDWDVPGMVVFGGYAWNYETLLDIIHVNSLEKVYFGLGLAKNWCNHMGSFTMNGKRQSNMASASI